MPQWPGGKIHMVRACSVLVTYGSNKSGKFAQRYENCWKVQQHEWNLETCVQFAKEKNLWAALET